MSEEAIETVEVECPECDHRFETGAEGDVVACEECNAAFARHTHIIGDDDETCYACGDRAKAIYLGTAEEGVVEVALCTDHAPSGPPARRLDAKVQAGP